MIKLYGAAWLIAQRSSDSPYLKVEIGQAVRDECRIFTPSVNLYRLNTGLKNENSPKISELVTRHKLKVPSVQAIICLGTEPVGGLLFSWC